MRCNFGGLGEEDDAERDEDTYRVGRDIGIGEELVGGVEADVEGVGRDEFEAVVRSTMRSYSAGRSRKRASVVPNHNYMSIHGVAACLRTHKQPIRGPTWTLTSTCRYP